MKLFITITLLLFRCCGMKGQQTDKEYHIKTSDGVTLYAHVRGHGAPCLYLHGGPGSGSTWMKDMGGEELEKRFTMIYLDQRGFCKSTAPADDNFSLVRQTLDFEEVRKALGIEKWFLLGHSFGGILEIGYWRDYPNSICGMIFEDCTLSMNTCFKDSWLPAALEIVGDQADPIAKDTTVALPARMAAIQKSLNDDTRALIFTDSMHKQVIDTLNSWTFHNDCVCHTDDQKVMMIEDYWDDFRPLASSVTVPVLFFVGKKDRAIGPDSYKDIHFPNAIIRIGNCGHFPFLESPKEWAAALEDYLEFCSSSLNKMTMNAQSEMIGGCVKKGGTESGISATSRFPLYSVMKFPQALYVSDYLTKNNIELSTKVTVRKDELMQDTWSPMLNTFEGQKTFTYSELLALSLQQSDNNACDILFEQCGGPRKVEKYIRNLGFKDIRIQKTEKQIHAKPALCNKNWCTPQSMVELVDWFIAHHNDNEPLRFIWKLMEECQTGKDRLSAAISSSAKVVHKTGTGYPLPSGLPSGICDVGIIILDNGQQFPIAVFITNPSSQSRISDVAKQLIEQ